MPGYMQEHEGTAAEEADKGRKVPPTHLFSLSRWARMSWRRMEGSLRTFCQSSSFIHA